MTPLDRVHERIRNIQARLRGSRTSPPVPADPAPGRYKAKHCGRCRVLGHTRVRCPIRFLHVWTNGAELWIADSAADAATLEREHDEAFSDGDAVPTPPAEWRMFRREGEPLTLVANGCAQQWAEHVWVRANGRCLLAFGNKLAPGRKTP